MEVESTVRIPIYKGNQRRNQGSKHSHDNAFTHLLSLGWQTICRSLAIILLPGLILFGGITVFITGCLKNIPPMIISGAITFVFGILFCLLCGHVCDGLTKRGRKRPRRSREENTFVAAV